MKLSPRQLARLRSLGRIANELELRVDAGRAAVRAQIDYRTTLRRQLEKLPALLASELHAPSSAGDAHVIKSKYAQEERRLRAEIDAAGEELRQMQSRASGVSWIAAPTRTLIDRILRYANLDEVTAGINFGAPDRAGAGEVITPGAPAAKARAAAPAKPATAPAGT